MDRFYKRREQIKNKIKEYKLDACLIMHPANRFYLSGFELHDPQCNESAGLIVILPNDRDYLLTDPRYYEAALRIWDKRDIFIYKNNKLDEIKDFLIKNNLKNIGFEPNIVSYEMYNALSKSLNMMPCKGIVENLREIKDEDELQAIENSCLINHMVLEKIDIEEIIGMQEKELEWEIEKSFRELGATELAFKSIVAVGKNAALPHYMPGNEEIKKGNCLLIDIGGRYENYCSDQTRTFWIGTDIPEYFEKALKLVREAQILAIENLRPGMVIKDLYFMVKDFFNSHGVGDRFTHALGHGVGLEVHEIPAIGPKNNKKFKPNMVITIEPGLYFPEWGGVRWEHMVVVTEKGAKVL